MSKADYPYADDEFDAPSGPDIPRGVHRAPRSAWSRWWPFVVVIVVVPLLAYALVTWASRDTTTDSGNDADPGTSAPAASATPTKKASTEPTAGASDEASDDASDEASEEPSGTPTAQVQLDAPVTVLNAAGIAGLAAKTVTQLEGAGFTAAKADNFSGTKPAESIVYYASDDLEPTAALVGETLGIDAVELSADQAGDGVTVVLLTAPQG